ncbi:MAG TPA: PadR family transcriptional regulator [Candidatus Binataceae bacterium]|nr:PadR family transcriptional regulator [Candidatus Binataceae bacterium]
MNEGSEQLRARLNRERGPIQTSGGPAFGSQTLPRMDIKFPILGFLMESEATGYDLKRRFVHPIGFFYRISDGSLYPALKKLAHDGLVTVRTDRRGRRTRKIYAITSPGRAQFTRMLREPAQPLFVFDEAEVKMYFSADEPETAIQHLERARLEDLARAPLLAQVVAQMRRTGESPVRIAVVEFGRILTNAKIRLLGRLITQLKRQTKTGRRMATPTGRLRAVSGGKR